MGKLIRQLRYDAMRQEAAGGSFVAIPVQLAVTYDAPPGASLPKICALWDQLDAAVAAKLAPFRRSATSPLLLPYRVAIEDLTAQLALAVAEPVGLAHNCQLLRCELHFGVTEIARVARN